MFGVNALMTNPDADISDPAIADARNPKRFTITLTNGPATVGLYAMQLLVTSYT